MYRLGGTVSAMKRLCQSTIGRIINYSASAIPPLSKANAGQLEAIHMSIMLKASCNDNGDIKNVKRKYDVRIEALMEIPCTDLEERKMQ